MKTLVSVLALAALLSACGGAGAGGTVPQTAQNSAPAKTANTSVPAVVGTEAPKQYDYGKTPQPSGSPGSYYGN